MGMHPPTFWQGMQCLSSPLAATNLCQSSQCHIQLSVDCHSSCMNYCDIWRWHSTSHHSLEDRMLKLANTICYIYGPRALILSIEKSLAAQFHSWLIRYLFYYCDHKKRSFQSKMHQKPSGGRGSLSAPPDPLAVLRGWGPRKGGEGDIVALHTTLLRIDCWN